MSKIDDLIKRLCTNGVEYKKFGYVAKYIRGVTYNKSQEALSQSTSNWKILRANNITLQTNTLNFEDVKEVKPCVKVKDEQILKKDDILICAGSGSKQHIGKVAYITEDIEYSFGGFMAVIRCSNEIKPRYLFHLLTSELFSKYLEVSLNSTTINNLNIKIMNDFEFPVPPIEIQQEIVRILDNFTNLTAELQAELQARKEQYEYYRNNLLTFDKDNPDVRWMKMGEIAKFTYGYTDKAKAEGDLRFIRISDILDNGCLNPEDAKYVSSSKETDTYLLKKGDLLMARTGATFGKTLYVESDEPAVYASFLIKITLPSDLINSRYYWHFSKSSLYWMQANKYVSRGGQQQFNANALGRVIIPIPTLQEQERIVSILDKFEALVNDLSTGLPAEIAALQEQYEYYRNKLLTFERTA